MLVWCARLGIPNGHKINNASASLGCRDNFISNKREARQVYVEID